MKSLQKFNMKFKKIEPEYIKVILDRLFRTKPAFERYERVFDDIIQKFLIKEKNDEISLNKISSEEKIKLATKIFNSSVEQNNEIDEFLHRYITSEEDRIFNKNPNSEIYLKEKLNLANAFELIKNQDDLKPNLVQILTLLENLNTTPKKLRENFSLLYPIEKIVLTEGATEEILLGEFAKLCDFDFNKNGILVIGAGGKNQVARKYYKMSELFKIPIFILLDLDAIPTKELIEPKLNKKDKIHLIKNGEFEDILPKNLIIQALNDKNKNGFQCVIEDFEQDPKTTKCLHEIFKQKGFGEFKKADFAKTIHDFLKSHPNSTCFLSDEIKEIIEEIKSL